LLAGFTLVFIIVCVTLYKPFADYCKYTDLRCGFYFFVRMYLFQQPSEVCFLPLVLLGWTEALRANVITKSGKAVETAGDIDVLLLDKTGTITIGNRKATNFYPVNGLTEKDFEKNLYTGFQSG